MITFADVEKKLSEVIPGYERRLPQERMATAIENSLADSLHGLFEAGCGTGKSFGALIPAILTGKRVVYSTATKALQDQITGKDLPDLKIFLEENFGIKFEWSLLKGRSNYICGARAEGVDSSEVKGLAKILKIINSCDNTFTGEKADVEAILGHEITFAEWAKIRADSEVCSDLLCSKQENSTCFATRARRVASKANIVVVNHALFSMDLIFSNAMLGRYDHVIFDEAHEFRTYVRDALGTEFSERSLMSLLTEVRNIARRDYPESEAVLAKAAAKATGAQSILFSTFDKLPDIKNGSSTARLRPDDFSLNSDVWFNYIIAIQEYAGTLEKLAPNLNGQSIRSLLPHQKRLQSLKKRARNLSNRVTNLVEADFAELVRWVEKEDSEKYGKHWIIKCCPIDVAPFLSENLFDLVPCILMSATLQINGKFDFIANQLGVSTYNSLNVGTTFDYENQARFYVPDVIPDPSQNRNGFEDVSRLKMKELIQASDGRALLLFTSIRAMKDAYEYLVDLPYTVLMQGGPDPDDSTRILNNKELALRFKQDNHSVLLATKSFMTGVDFQGDTCSLVILDKLPFPVPTEPLFEAEAELMDRKSPKSSFNGLSVPIMSLVISQAVGRLIRTKTDTGVFALMDPRINSRNYGSKIKNSLPPAPMVQSISEVKDFFSKGK